MYLYRWAVLQVIHINSILRVKSPEPQPLLLCSLLSKMDRAAACP
jgi:hypothetical protein